jgi:hypothetical protein
MKALIQIVGVTTVLDRLSMTITLSKYGSPPASPLLRRLLRHKGRCRSGVTAWNKNVSSALTTVNLGERIVDKKTPEKYERCAFCNAFVHRCDCIRKYSPDASITDVGVRHHFKHKPINVDSYIDSEDESL